MRKNRLSIVILLPAPLVYSALLAAQCPRPGEYVYVTRRLLCRISVALYTTDRDCKELFCGQTKPDCEMPTCQTMTFELPNASQENIFINTSSDSKMSFEIPLAEQGDIVTANLHRFHVDNFSNKPKASDKSVVFSAIKQTIEQMDLPEEPVITIIVPDGISEKQPILTSQVILHHQFTEEENLDTENLFCKESEKTDEILETEHSYCRHELDRNHLWETIAKLQSKIALLEVQENVTLFRLRSLEAVIRKLNQENLLSDEKLEIIDSCQNNFDFAMVQ
ncbi:THAP domain-containing protein 5 [Mixophyes fleayi]|uniref:THAP domain-containing protein 5 n=1 Tax=Mixophyes fleayi TaxID=3061075 RepID=UPI003F4D7C21